MYKFISNAFPTQINLRRQEYPSFAEEAFLISGRQVFDIRVATARISDLEGLYKNKPPLTEEFGFSWKEIGLINEHIELFNDIDTLRECLTFVYDERNRPDAISGKHDDLLFSDMIANEIRGRMRVSVQAPAAVDADFNELDGYLKYGG